MDFHTHSSKHLSEESDADLLTAADEETLVTDSRAGLSPAQMVDRRLASLLQGGPPAGQLPSRGSLRAR